MMTRRALGAALAAPFVLSFVRSALAEDREARLAALEQRHGGRLGVAVLDAGSGARYGRRLDERFPMCSTFKTLLAAAVLARVDDGKEQLDRRIVASQKDLVAYAPVVEKRLGPPGLTVADLCGAAVTWSDNAAANLLLASIGGPARLTDFLRAIGDVATRLDRIEPELNESLPDDPRDTTTPAAMVETLRKLTLGRVLQAPSRAQLIEWLRGNKVGDKRLRAGMPKGWVVGDKTGTGARGSTNDAGLLWPPTGAPLIVAVYYTGAETAPAEAREAVIADVARLVTGA